MPLTPEWGRSHSHRQLTASLFHGASTVRVPATGSGPGAHGALTPSSRDGARLIPQSLEPSCTQTDKETGRAERGTHTHRAQPRDLIQLDAGRQSPSRCPPGTLQAEQLVPHSWLMSRKRSPPRTDQHETDIAWATRLEPAGAGRGEGCGVRGSRVRTMAELGCSGHWAGDEHLRYLSAF